MTELQAKHPAQRAASGVGSHNFVACSMRLRRGLRIGGVLLAAVCSVSGAWRGVNFATNTASPLHAEGATNTVAAAFAVVRCIELAELIFLGSTPSSAEREALGYYAARKWGAPVDASGANARETLDGMGVSHGTLFTLILIIR